MTPRTHRAPLFTSQSPQETMPTTKQKRIIGGQYEIVKLLGKGSFGKVWESVHTQSKARFAAKSIRRKAQRCDRTSDEPDFGPELEISTMRMVHDHPNIISLHRTIRSENNLFLLLQLAHGDLFEHVAQEKGVLSEEESCSIIGQVLRALAHMHERGIGHRDLKLENIMLVHTPQYPFPTALVGDFGHSTVLKTCSRQCGTLEYMAPEIVRGNNYCPLQADIYSAGVILYAMLTGELPFDGPTPRETQNLIKAGNLLWPASSTVSANAKNMVHSMLHLDPSERPTATTLLQHPFITGDTAGDSRPLAQSPQPEASSRQKTDDQPGVASAPTMASYTHSIDLPKLELEGRRHSDLPSRSDYVSY